MEADILVYILDDNDEDIYLFKKMLANRENEVMQVQATSTVIALEALFKFSLPDVLVIDLNLPESQGLNTLIAVRKFASDTPIIVLTGNDERLGIKALKLGAQDYLLKDDVSPALLRRAILFSRERFQLHAAIEKLAKVDRLTGLHNRAAFNEKFEAMIAGFERSKASFALLFMDLDDFKVINDQYGHLAGDQLLKSIAQRMQFFNRNTDFLARFGGDEFVLLAPNIDNEETLAQLIAAKTKILDGDYSFISSDKQLISLPIGLSIGGAIMTDDMSSAEALLDLADKKMYHSKKVKKHSAKGAAS